MVRRNQRKRGQEAGPWLIQEKELEKRMKEGGKKLGPTRRLDRNFWVKKRGRGGIGEWAQLGGTPNDQGGEKGQVEIRGC